MYHVIQVLFETMHLFDLLYLVCNENKGENSETALQKMYF